MHGPPSADQRAPDGHAPTPGPLPTATGVVVCLDDTCAALKQLSGVRHGMGKCNPNKPSGSNQQQKAAQKLTLSSPKAFCHRSRTNCKLEAKIVRIRFIRASKLIVQQATYCCAVAAPNVAMASTFDSLLGYLYGHRHGHAKPVQTAPLHIAPFPLSCSTSHVMAGGVHDTDWGQPTPRSPRESPGGAARLIHALPPEMRHSSSDMNYHQSMPVC